MALSSEIHQGLLILPLNRDGVCLFISAFNPLVNDSSDKSHLTVASCTVNCSPTGGNGFYSLWRT